MDRIGLYIFFLLIISLITQCYAQSTPFHKDSLARTGNSKKFLKQLPLHLIQGVIASDYKKNNEIEYLPLTSLELPTQLLPTDLGHPRMITESDIRQAHHNILREPYVSWYQLIKDHVERYIIVSNPILNEPVFRQAEDIKILAFIYQVENDPRYLRAAIRLLEQLPEPPKILNLEGGTRGQGWGDFLESAQALPAICVALDLIYYHLPVNLLHDTRCKISEIADQLTRAMIYTPNNNHTTVMATAVLSVSMVEDQPKEFIVNSRQELWQQGLTYLSRGLGLIAPDGGYAEGIYYGNYIINYIAPFSVYFFNVTGLKLFGHPYLERMINWLIANDKGSGHYTSLDDAYQEKFLILPPIIYQSRLKRNWSAYWNSLPKLNAPLNNLVESISKFEDIPNSELTSEPAVQFFPESGQIIFRDKSLNPQLFASFASEREMWLAGRHEHIDPLNFELSAYGEDLIVEGGYGEGTGDVNRRWYISPQAHNSILINGFGTNRNPIWGDPIESRLSHEFITSQSASATMNYELSDIDIQRKIYFIQNKYILMVDQFDGSQPFSPSLNFNYLGDLQQINQNQIRLKNNHATLNLLFLSTSENNPRINKNYGLYTPPNGPKPLRSIQLEQSFSRSGHTLSFLYPQNATESQMYIHRLAIQGEGDVYRFKDISNLYSESDLAANRGIQIKSDRWQTNARVIMVKYNGSRDVSGLLLISFTEFKSNNISIYVDFPINIFLEENETNWQGYIESSEKIENHITISGIQEFPFRFNKITVNPTKELNSMKQYDITGCGTVDIGSGVISIRRPYRFHTAPDMLVWLSRQSNPKEQYSTWSDYRQKIFQNQLTEHMRRGIELGGHYWSSKIFRDSLVIKHGVYAISGIFQDSYDENSQSTFSFQIPHRYQLNWNIKNTSFSVNEDGIFSSDRINIRNLMLNAQFINGKGFLYRGGNWFTDHQMHHVRFYNMEGNQISYQISKFRQIADQQIQLQYRIRQVYLNPGYAWNNTLNEKDVSLNWQIARFAGNFVTSHRDGIDQYYQSLSAYNNKSAFTIEGKQETQYNTQEYFANWLYHLTPNLSVSQGGKIKKSEKWDVTQAYTELNLTKKDMNIRGILEHQYNQLTQFFSTLWYLNNHQFSTSINLINFKFKQQNQFRFRWSCRSAQNYRLYTNLTYKYNSYSDNYKVNLLHTFSIPINKKHSWQPIIGEILPEKDPIQWIGSGYSYIGKHNIFAQILAKRVLPTSIIDYEMAVDLKNRERKPILNLWIHLLQQKSQILSSEIRILLLTNSLQPGIYYSYLKNGGSRFEGFLHWWW